MDQMIREGYLVTGEYQVVKTGDIRPLKDPETKILVKITDADKIPKKAKKSKASAYGMDSLTSEGTNLFERLRALRLQIAREEQKPPYIVFTDKTLVAMAAKRPRNKVEMLRVSGVGETKFERYGEQFLEVIRKDAN